MTGTSAVTARQRRADRGGAGWTTRVLICDDRTGRTFGVTAITAHPPATDIRCVSDGVALEDAFAERPVDVVLIDVHGGATGPSPADWTPANAAVPPANRRRPPAPGEEQYRARPSRSLRQTSLPLAPAHPSAVRVASVDESAETGQTLTVTRPHPV